MEQTTEWLFDGIGTEIISLVIGLLIGGGAGYRIGVRKTVVRQSEKAGDNAIQQQIGTIDVRNK